MGIALEHWSETWAGETYNTLLVKEFPSEYLIPLNDEPDYVPGDDVSFIYPLMYANKYYLDGIIEGHISIYNSSAADTADIDSYTVSLSKQKDTDITPTVLATMTRTITTYNTIPTEDYLTLPLYMPITRQRVDANEKLIWRTQFTASGAGAEDCGVACANDSSVLDMKVVLPYAPTG